MREQTANHMRPPIGVNANPPKLTTHDPIPWPSWPDALSSGANRVGVTERVISEPNTGGPIGLAWPF